MVKLNWRDSEDVYKPISHSIWDFLQNKKLRINDLESRGIEELYRQLSNQKMIIFVEREAEIQLIHHLSIDPYNETGGVFVGQAYFCKETNTHYTEIIGSIAAPHTIGNRVHFQLTAESWPDIFKNHKQNYPTTTILGWYHSHPGHGVFLSGTDLNTQRSTFNKVWQISTVYDTLHKDIGYFYGADGTRTSPVYLQDVNENSLFEEPQLPDNSALCQAGYITDETNQQQQVSGQIQPVRTGENPQNINGDDEDEPEDLSSQENINFLSALKGIFTGFKIIFDNLMLLLSILIKGAFSLATNLIRLFWQLIERVFKLFKGFKKK